MEQQLVTPARATLPTVFEAALRDLETQIVERPEKAVPPGSFRLADIGKQGWNLLRGDVPLPSMVLNWIDLQHNIALMQSYCFQQGVWLAPHGKTTMAPQIWAEQVQAGAWAITVANVSQAEVCRAFGVPRTLIANELASDYDIRYLEQLLRESQGREVYCLVDSVRGVERLAAGLARLEIRNPLRVLVELGIPGGRCGARTLAEVEAVADAVLSVSPVLQLVGIEGFEGIVSEAAVKEAFLQSLLAAVDLIRPRVPATETCLVSAGGSVYFDRVIEILGPRSRPDLQLVLRSGCYVTHDSGRYESLSPFGLKARQAGVPALRPALEIWSAVLSRPEPELVILGMGKRDMPTDMGLPIPLVRARPGHPPASLDRRFTVLRANDQHTYVQVPADCDLAVGDLVASGISHPCTAFDKWRILLVTDSDRNIVGAVRTFF